MDIMDNVILNLNDYIDVEKALFHKSENELFLLSEMLKNDNENPTLNSRVIERVLGVSPSKK